MAYAACELGGCILNITQDFHYHMHPEDYLGNLFGNGIDISGTDLMTDTSSRRQQDLLVPYPLADNSLTTLVTVSEASQTLKNSFWNFADPFHESLWLTMVGSVIFSAAIMFGLERIQWKPHSPRPFEEGNYHHNTSAIPSGLCHSVILGIYHSTGAGGFTPTSTESRIFLASFSFVIMILMSSYTVSTVFLALNAAAASSASSSAFVTLCCARDF